MKAPLQNRTIRTRRFGNTELVVSEFGLGCARIGGIFKRQPSEFVDLLAAAFDAGVNFFDTADIYSQGESERLIGRTFRRRRSETVIASKAGYVLPSQRRLAARVKPLIRPAIRLLRLDRHRLPGAVRGELSQNFSPAHLRRALEGSLRRLDTDYLDLFQLHSPPTGVIEAGDWVETLESLKREGKIRYYGISCDSIDAARAALNYEGVSSLQVAVNLLEQGALEVLPSVEERGVALIARECLANGLLIKDMDNVDVRSYCESDSEAALKIELLHGYRRAAADAGTTLPEFALRFVNDLAGVAVTLIGVSSQQQFDSLIHSLPTPAPPVER